MSSSETTVSRRTYYIARHKCLVTGVSYQSRVSSEAHVSRGTHKCRECVLQCVAVCCSVLQCVAVCCSVLQCVAVCCSVLQCVAVCCSVLQCVAVCCSVLQRLVCDTLVSRLLSTQ